MPYAWVRVKTPNTYNTYNTHILWYLVISECAPKHVEELETAPNIQFNYCPQRSVSQNDRVSNICPNTNVIVNFFPSILSRFLPDAADYFSFQEKSNGNPMGFSPIQWEIMQGIGFCPDVRQPVSFSILWCQ